MDYFSLMERTWIEPATLLAKPFPGAPNAPNLQQRVALNSLRLRRFTRVRTPCSTAAPHRSGAIMREWPLNSHQYPHCVIYDA